MTALEDHDTVCFECGESQVVYDLYIDGSDCPKVLYKIKAATELCAMNTISAFKRIGIKAEKLNRMVFVECDRTEEFERIRIEVAQGILCEVDGFDRNYFYGVM